jgi:lycopene beta-cyclase
MTYRQFLVFALAPGVATVATLLVARISAAGEPAAGRVRRAAAVVVGLAVGAAVYTTPWDGWMIRRSVWWYPPDSVVDTAVRVPVEEYLFMVGMTLLVGCWTVLVALPPAGGPPQPLAPPEPLASWRRPVAAAGWLLLAGCGVTAAALSPRALYLGSALAWFCPPLALQSAVGADVLRAVHGLRLRGMALAPLLWVADGVAIHAGAWQVGSAHTVGLAVLGLPVEEIVFYFLTSMLIVDTVLLCGHPQVRARLARG